MSEWPMVKLGEVCKINPHRDKSITSSTEISFIEMKSLLENGNVHPVTVPAEKYLKGYTPFQKHDILIAKITPCFQNGKIGLANIDTDFGFGTTEFHVVRSGETLSPEYLTFFLRQQWILDAGETCMTGSGGQRRGPKAFLENLKLPLPPLGEQKRIAEILGGVSKAIQILEHELQLLGEISVLEQQNNLSTQKLSDLVTIRSGTVDPTSSVNRNLPHIAPDSIEKNTGRILQIRSCEEDKVTSGKYHFYKGDVLYSKIRPYLNKVVIAPFEGLCSADMYALRPKEGINSEVLQALLMSKDFLAYAEQWSGRASIPKINRKALLAYNVPKMTDKQVNEVKAKIQSIHKVVELKCRKLSLLQELQKSLANRAFAGLL